MKQYSENVTKNTLGRKYTKHKGNKRSFNVIENLHRLGRNWGRIKTISSSPSWSWQVHKDKPCDKLVKMHLHFFFSCQYRHPGEYQAFRGYPRSLVRSTRDVKEMYIEKRKIHCLVCKLPKENENLPNYTNILLKNWKTTSHQSRKSYPLWFGTLHEMMYEKIGYMPKSENNSHGCLFFLLRMHKNYASYWGGGIARSLPETIHDSVWKGYVQP